VWPTFRTPLLLTIALVVGVIFLFLPQIVGDGDPRNFGADCR